MEHWHFFPWATQYLIGGSVILFAAVYLLHKNKKSWIYRVFFFLGLFIALWQFSAFLHRIAPTALLSKQFFRLDVFFVLPITSFLLLMFLFFIGEKGIYTIVLVPPFVIGLLGLLMSPFEIIWVGPDLGWTYRFKPYFALIAYGVPMVYTVPVLLVAYILIKKSGRALRKKLTLILYGFLGCYWGITLLNVVMQKVTSLPPFGGVSGTFLFLIIAYVMDLPMEKLSSSFGSRKLAERLSSAYVDFLNALEDKIPGKELGESRSRFLQYVEAMGLRDTVVRESGRLVFRGDKFTDADISEAPDNILRIVKEHSWGRETMDAFGNVFVRTYETLGLKSKDAADEWLQQMLQRHGVFLAEQGILAAMPKQVKIPNILKKLQSGRICLFQEEKPVEAYQLVKEILSYGFASLCISKLHPGKLKERYGVREDSIFWLTFEKGEGTISPKDIDKLNKMVSEFVEGTRPGIVLLDCLDQIKFANGFQKSLAMLKDLRNLCSKNDSIVLISVNPEMFEKQELQAIEKGLKEVKTE